MLEVVPVFVGVEGGEGALEGGDTHGPAVLGQLLLSFDALLLAEGGGGAGDLGLEEPVGVPLDLVYLALFGDQEAEAGVLFS